MVTSLAHTFAEIFLAQGIAVGLGLGILYVPAVSCVMQWFKTKRATANGILASGSSVGAMVFPIILNYLGVKGVVSFAWAVRISVNRLVSSRRECTVD